MSIEDGTLVLDFEVQPGEYLSAETGESGEIIALVVNQSREDGHPPVRLGFTPRAALHLAWAMLGAVLTPIDEAMEPPTEDTGP